MGWQDAPIVGGGGKDESAFRSWYAFHAKKQGLDPDPDNPEHFYDYRAAFRAGAKPDKSGHWPSQFKREGHPNLVIAGVDTRTGQPVAQRAAWESAPVIEEAPQAQPAAPGRNTSPSTIGPLPWYQQDIVGGVSVQDALNALPVIGGAAGGMVGGAGGTAFGVGFGGVPGAVGGAALGGAGGEAANQLIRRAVGIGGVPTTPGEAAQRIAVQGGVQGGAEGLGRGVVGGVRRVAAPFARSVSAPVAAAAQRQGVEMPAAALSDSRVVPLAEALSAKGLGGGKTAERYTEANRFLTAAADHVVKRASKFADASEAGRAIAEGLDAFRNSWIKQKSALYRAAALPEKGLKLQAKETVALLSSIVNEKEAAGNILKGGPTADATFYRGLLDGLTKIVKRPDGSRARVLRDVEAKDLLSAMRELKLKIQASFADPFSAANKGTLKKVSATMDAEFQAALQTQNPALAAKLAAANKAYAEGLLKINSTFGKRIHTLAKEEKFDKIATAIANPRVSVDDIPKIIEVAGPEGAEGMRMAVLADLVSKAKNSAGQLTPQGLGRAVKTFGEDRLEALLKPDQWAKINDLATLSGAMEKGTRVSGGSQTAFLARYGALPAGLMTNLPATLGYLVADTSFNRFVASKAGQRWLTGGFQPFSTEAAKRAVTLPAHAATTPFVMDGPPE